MLLVLGGTYHIFKAFKETSFYYLVVGILYMYFGFSYIVLDLFEKSGAMPKTVGQIQMLYFIISAAGLAFLLVRLNNKLKKDAGL
jgi:hypothetical protein